jgi:glycosyltransferase involved in cell wall biosynthesis
LEVLIVDDGSTDDTESICRQFPASVRYIRQENAGVGAARNHGLREAKGDWIAFADSDDPWEKNKLEVQLEVVRRWPEIEWCITGCTVIDLAGQPISGLQSWTRVFAAFGRGAVDPDVHFARWLERAEVSVGGSPFRVYKGDAYGLLFLGNVVLPSSALIRRDLAVRLGGFDEAFRLAEETEFFHRVAAVSPVGIVMAPLARYRVGQAQSLVSPGNIDRLIVNALASGEGADRLRPNKSAAEQRAVADGRARLFRELAYARLSTLDQKGARAAIQSAWRSGSRGARTVSIFLASLLPASALKSIRALKHSLSRR